MTPCEKPHPIVWAKLAGYPCWPGKAVGYCMKSESKASKWVGRKSQINLKLRLDYHADNYGWLTYLSSLGLWLLCNKWLPATLRDDIGNLDRILRTISEVITNQEKAKTEVTNTSREQEFLKLDITEEKSTVALESVRAVKNSAYSSPINQLGVDMWKQ